MTTLPNPTCVVVARLLPNKPAILFTPRSIYSHLKKKHRKSMGKCSTSIRFNESGFVLPLDAGETAIRFLQDEWQGKVHNFAKNFIVEVSLKDESHLKELVAGLHRSGIHNTSFFTLTEDITREGFLYRS
jgi:hypothetical protein